VPHGFKYQSRIAALCPFVVHLSCVNCPPFVLLPAAFRKVQFLVPCFFASTCVLSSLCYKNTSSAIISMLTTQSCTCHSILAIQVNRLNNYSSRKYSVRSFHCRCPSVLQGLSPTIRCFNNSVARLTISWPEGARMFFLVKQVRKVRMRIIATLCDNNYEENMFRFHARQLLIYFFCSYINALHSFSEHFVCFFRVVLHKNFTYWISIVHHFQRWPLHGCEAWVSLIGFLLLWDYCLFDATAGTTRTL